MSHRVRVLNGYRVLYRPEHERAMANENWKGFVYEHIVIAQEFLGRSLREEEVIHHLDGDRANNRSGNLLVLERGQHTKLHMWLDSGAPTHESRRLNGVNSEKPKSGELKYCEVCSRTLQEKQVRFCSTECNFSKRRTSSVCPGREQLESELGSMSREAIGRKYGVSGNAVKKWAKRYDLIW